MTWNDFLEQIGNAEESTLPWVHKNIYRGHACYDWNLKPSILRSLPELPHGVIAMLETQAVEWFRARSGNFLPSHKWKDSDQLTYWWCLMRHHGAPTRVLDWTVSPYVAAYFAVSDKSDTDGAVWSLDVDAASEVLTQEHTVTREALMQMNETERFQLNGSPPDDLVFVEARQLSDRMTAQQGVFSICRNARGDHGEILLRLSQKYERDILHRICIPADHKKDFLKRLREMNVTASALFPGLDGLGRSINEMVELSGEPLDREFSMAVVAAARNDNSSIRESNPSTVETH